MRRRLLSARLSGGLFLRKSGTLNYPTPALGCSSLRLIRWRAWCLNIFRDNCPTLGRRTMDILSGLKFPQPTHNADYFPSFARLVWQRNHD